MVFLSFWPRFVCRDFGYLVKTQQSAAMTHFKRLANTTFYPSINIKPFLMSLLWALLCEVPVCSVDLSVNQCVKLVIKRIVFFFRLSAQPAAPRRNLTLTACKLPNPAGICVVSHRFVSMAFDCPMWICFHGFWFPGVNLPLWISNSVF